METIKFKLLHPDAKLPARAHDTDACYDVFATSREEYDGLVTYGFGFATEIPAGWVGYVYPRSSIRGKDLLLSNSVGIIDADYRGEWMASFRLVQEEKGLGIFGLLIGGKGIYAIGDRIAQIQFRKLDTYALALADDLNDTPRGTGGFGSTGA